MEFPAGVVDKAGWTDLKELDEHGHGLTSWEIEFVESLHKKLRAGRFLSDMQRATLADIREARL